LKIKNGYSSFQARLRFLAGTFFILFIFAFSACSDATDPLPKPEDLSFQYLPDIGLINLMHGDERQFVVEVSPSVQFSSQWQINSSNDGTGTSYQYSASRIGVDTLRVDASYSSVTWGRTWYISVQENQSTAPPAVGSVSIEHGPVAADVVVGWDMITTSTYTMNEYLVKMSYDGPITAENWDDAVLLGAYPHLHNQVGYSITFSAADGMIAGANAWFAVRGIDETGQMSGLTFQTPHQISSPWFIEGTVYADDGRALPNVIIDYGCSSCRVNADSEGHFSIGPVPNVSVYDLVTMADESPGNGEPFDSFYNFTMRDIHYQPDGNYDIMILTRYGLDESCDNFDFEFINFFKETTRTFFQSVLRPNHRLYKWETYPVAVYVPPFVSDEGVDFQPLCQEVVEFWNIAMGEDYLVVVDTPEEAGIEFYFGNEGSAYAGNTFLSKPDDQNYLLGDIVPEKVKIYIWDQLVASDNIRETSMHELGHALGLFTHTICSGPGFLMNANPSGILDNGPENAVHPDEKRAVRAIRNLRQGTDMEDFEFY